jgi:hypothetical protein
MTDTQRRILLYAKDELKACEVERLAACYGYIVANPIKNGEGVTLLNRDGSRLTPPAGITVWVSDLIASERDEETP